MADHSKPTLTSNYTAFVDEIKGRLEDISKGFDPAKTSPTNVPVDTIRWAGSSNKWQRWNGSAWVDLASTYAISISGSAAKLTTARSVALAGGATGSASFDGSANITINVTALNPSQLASPVPINKGGTGAASAAQARTNLGLGAAATRDVGIASGNVILQKIYGASVRNAQGNFASLNSTPNSPDAWNADSKYSLFLENNNNALAVFVSSPTNERIASIQVGHNNPLYANALGTLHLNPLGGNVTVNGNTVYHSGNLPDIDWNSLTGKPSTFPPSSHTHPWSQITGAPATATRWPTWGEVTGKPTIFPTNWDNVAGKPSGFTPPTTHGAVGTYAFVNRRGSDGTTSWGSTISGSLLAPSFVGTTGAYQGEGTALSGTWRIMGRNVVRTTFGSNSSYSATLAVRIA